MAHTDADSWDNVLKAYELYRDAENELLKSPNRVQLIHKAIKSERSGRQSLAFRLIWRLTDVEKQQLAGMLLDYGFSAQYTYDCRDLLLSLPREWLLENIERLAEPFLAEMSAPDLYQYYGTTLWLYSQIDRELTQRLVKRALEHPYPDVREFGKDYLEKLGEINSQ